MARRMRSHFLFKTSLFVVLLSFACVGVPSAQEKKGTAPSAKPEQRTRVQRIPQKASGWSVRCTNPGMGLSCKATQTIGNRKTRKRVLSVSVSKPRKGKRGGGMLLQLPLGLFLPAGVTMGVDVETPERLTIQTCNAKGCFAGAPLTPDKLTAMTTGTKLFVTFQNMKKQKVVVPVPLKGFAEAYKKM